MGFCSLKWKECRNLHVPFCIRAWPPAVPSRRLNRGSLQALCLHNREPGFPCTHNDMPCLLRAGNYNVRMTLRAMDSLDVVEALIAIEDLVGIEES